MDVHSVDFAALRVLRMVHAHGSFTRAAEALGSTQSAVSYTIDRLRRAFDDPLFVRQGTGTVPTERCLEIVAEAGRLLLSLEAVALESDDKVLRAIVDMSLITPRFWSEGPLPGSSGSGW